MFLGLSFLLNKYDYYCIKVILKFMKRTIISFSVLSLLIIFGILFTLFESCKHDPVYTDVCFDTQVLPIFVSNCAISGCHDANTAAEGYILTDYTNIMKGVSPKHPNKSKVYTCLSGVEDRMPISQPLNSDQIGIIRSWIMEGAEETICSTAPTPCDSINVTYTNTMKAFFDGKCIGCHNPSGSMTDPTFNTYAGASSYAIDEGMDLYNKVAGGTHNGIVLTTCEKAQLKNWIQSGAPN